MGFRNSDPSFSIKLESTNRMKYTERASTDETDGQQMRLQADKIIGLWGKMVVYKLLDGRDWPSTLNFVVGCIVCARTHTTPMGASE